MATRKKWSRRPISGPSAARCARAIPIGFWSRRIVHDGSVIAAARTFFSLCLALLLVGCAPPKPPTAKLTLTPARFGDLPGWNSDASAEALAAFIKSCVELERRPDGAAVGPATLGMTAAAWRKPCAAA